MRRIKKLAIVAVVLAVVMVATGCGCACDTSGSSGGNDQNTTSGQNTGSNNGKVDDGKSNTKTANSDFEPTISLEQRKAVKAEDFIQGKNFDLTGYAEALGFTRLDDPDGGVMYAIKNGNTKCFFTYDENQIITWFDCGDGYVYQTDPIGCEVSPADYDVVSRGQENKTVSTKGLERIVNALTCLSLTEDIKMDSLSGFRAVFKVQGPAKYYSNGLIKAREVGQNIVETISQK